QDDGIPCFASVIPTLDQVKAFLNHLNSGLLSGLNGIKYWPLGSGSLGCPSDSCGNSNNYVTALLHHLRVPQDTIDQIEKWLKTEHGDFWFAGFGSCKPLCNIGGRYLLDDEGNLFTIPDPEALVAAANRYQ
ncbi:MAG: hypothetical protein M3021_00060, partial [Actinomycetota bacterium]|nr:hypothetical protein [Actinomycetota bacterium]